MRSCRLSSTRSNNLLDKCVNFLSLAFLLFLEKFKFCSNLIFLLSAVLEVVPSWMDGARLSRSLGKNKAISHSCIRALDLVNFFDEFNSWLNSLKMKLLTLLFRWLLKRDGWNRLGKWSWAARSASIPFGLFFTQFFIFYFIFFRRRFLALYPILIVCLAGYSRCSVATVPKPSEPAACFLRRKRAQG